MDIVVAARFFAAEELRDLAVQLERQDGFAEVQASLAAGHGGTLGGVWGSSCALVAAALTRNCPATLVVVLPRARDIDDFCDDLALFADASVGQFPAWESDAGERVLHDEIFGARLRLLKQFQEDCRDPTDRRSPEIVVTSIQSLLQPVPSQDKLREATRTASVGDALDVGEFTRWLTSQGCQSTTAIELPGEFSLRGGILDVFPPDALNPVRIELFGDEVESIRSFDVATQRSIESHQSVDLTVLQPNQAHRTHFASYLPSESWFLLIEPNQLREEGRYYHQRLERPEDFFATTTTLSEIYKFPSVTASGIPAGSFETTAHLQFESIERFSGDVHRVRQELDEAASGQRVYLVAETEAEIERLTELFCETQLAAQGRLQFVQGRLASGFRLVRQQVVLVSAPELFQRQEMSRPAQRKLGRAIDSFLQLGDGDLVVHVAHGIGRYRGLKLLEKEGGAEEHLEVEFNGGTRIYVPTSKIDLVQKYVGGRKATPKLATIGGKAWLRQKQAAERAVTDLAVEMIELQAARSARPGILFPTDSQWQQEFDAAFPYQETPDQLTALAAIKQDMQDHKPMDRLLCGDVGFGKTELAIRAAFKAIDAGYQVAVLVPTTVLAEQHQRTFSQRMAEFPFEIAALSRFCTAKQQRVILERAAEGKVDLVIGTHRLVSPDVRFQNLGLVIIDEEQRFGVTVKERLKALRASVDVLTMTATPIPRTLHMSLLGLRDISSLATPPLDRRAIVTEVAPYNARRVKQAIDRELAREGQVFFVHNRVHDIQSVADDVRRLVPDARIIIGHGQMPGRELEAVMLAFMRRQADILVCTTIIESGIDIPTANTMFIDDANMYGLSELHQLRGRVGRYKNRAYCYMLLPRKKPPTETALKRLKAIENFSMLGAGFKVALRDLEIRGAGNLLGPEQSGHIAAVGYEMYCQLLEQAVSDLKDQKRVSALDTVIDLAISGGLPKGYIPSDARRMDAYRRISRANDLETLRRVEHDLATAYGALPKSAEVMIQLAQIRILATQRGIDSIRRHENDVIFVTSRPKDLAACMDPAVGTLRMVGQPDPRNRVEVYYRPPVNYFEDGTLLAVLRKRLTAAPAEAVAIS